MADINDLSVTDASNTARFPESMARASVNNAARALEGMIARWHKDNNGSLATGGTSTAITVTLNQSSIAAWYDGLTFAARITTTCGATPTINPTGSGALGAKSLYWSASGVQVTTDDLQSGAVASFMYEATSDKVYVFGATTIAAASETVAGKAEIATQTETDTGTDDARIVTPLKLKTLAADFFTGAKTATATDTTRGTVEFAIQSEMETASSNVLVPTPGRMHYHPGVAKCWGYVTYSAGTPTLAVNYNITSIADDGTGLLGVTIATDFSTANYALTATGSVASPGSVGGSPVEDSDARAAGAFQLQYTDHAGGTTTDPVSIGFMAFGDLA